MKKKKKQEKDPNSLSARRGRARAQMQASVRIIKVDQHKPWTYVEFHATYWPDHGGDPRTLKLWGVSKISWPDRWNTRTGVEVAIDRGIAWALKLVVPPSYANLSEAANNLQDLIVEKTELQKHAETRAMESLTA